VSDRSDLAKYNVMNVEKNEINYSEVSYKRVVERLEGEVEEDGDSIGLEYEEGWMRYDELNECGNVLGYRLGLNHE
ncbi:hypothetical protein, partial [Staphylococcus epidermidis]|uniref:hypothetical protein n=1 Tax=Staphylococcus epidermidis TaxID=1282 RepID=UPI001642DE3A